MLTPLGVSSDAGGMRDIESSADMLVPGILGREMQLIRDAVLLVVSGGSSRVTVAGLRFGDALLEPARRLAAEHGVAITPQWSADEVGISLLVERLPESQVSDG